MRDKKKRKRKSSDKIQGGHQSSLTYYFTASRIRHFSKNRPTSPFPRPASSPYLPSPRPLITVGSYTLYPPLHPYFRPRYITLITLIIFKLIPFNPSTIAITTLEPPDSSCHSSNANSFYYHPYSTASTPSLLFSRGLRCSTLFDVSIFSTTSTHTAPFPPREDL